MSALTGSRRPAHGIASLFARRAVAGLVVLFAILVGSLGIAGALPGGIAGASGTTSSTAASTSTSSPSFICASGNSSSTSADAYLPINRWADATSTQHTRLSLNLFNIGNLPNVVQRDFVVADAQALGNTFWKAGVGLTEAATRFCFADSVASTADGLTATIGKALSNGGLVALLLVAAAILILVRLRRGDGTARNQIVKILVVLLVFAVMVNGAEQTTTGANGQVSFGFGSPGWVLTHVYDAVSTVASAPAAALSGVADNLSFGSAMQQKIDAEDPLSCGNYVNNLRTDYRNAYGSSAGSNMAATVPLALDSMWEQSGLTTYAYAQFGANNDYAPLVYCRLLEANANISPAAQVAITDQTPRAAAILAGTADSGGGNTAMAWASDQNLGNSPNDTTDESMIGWAACQTNSTSFTPMEWSSTTGSPVPSEWASVVDPAAQGSTYGASGTVTPSLCRAFFDNPFNGLRPQGTALEWPDNPGQISTAAAGPGGPFNGFADYVDNLHGTSNGSAEMLSIMFLISSAVDLLVFGLMAGAVLVAKFSLLFLMAFAAIFLLLSLWPGAAASSRLAGLAKHAFSMVLFVTGAQVILSIVAITTSIIMQTGTAVAGQGTFLSLLWMGIAPIAAIFIVHHLFKQVLKAPSPFKLSSALAWGSAAGGIGAGVAAGLERIGSRRAVWGTTKRAIGAARAPFDAARLERKHAMEPAGAQAQLNGAKSDAQRGAPGVEGSAPTAGAVSGAGGAGAIGPGSAVASTSSGGANGKAATGASVSSASGVARDAGEPAAATVGAGHRRQGRSAGVPTTDETASVLSGDAGATAAAKATVASERPGAADMLDRPPSDATLIADDGTTAPIDALTVAGASAGVASAGVASAGAVDAGVARGAVVGGGGTATRTILRGRLRRKSSGPVTKTDVPDDSPSATTPAGASLRAAYGAALSHAARKGRLVAGPDGFLRTKGGRLVGAPVPNERGMVTEADTRSAHERLHDDRVLRRAAVRTGRQLNRQALSERASANLLNRFAATHKDSRLGKAAGALGAAETVHGRAIQRVGERTRRAAAEFRSRPIRRQIASVAKVGAMGVAATALLAAPPALGVAAGAYALRRAHKARFGMDALHAANQRHIATFKQAAAADRARRHEEGRAAAIKAREQMANKAGDAKGAGDAGEIVEVGSTAPMAPVVEAGGRPVENEPSAEQPPLRDAPEDMDDQGVWTPPDPEPLPSPMRAAEPREPQQAEHQQAPGRAAAASRRAAPQHRLPAHEPPRSAAEVLRADASAQAGGPSRPAADQRPPSRSEPHAASHVPSHLVGNRRPNQPTSGDEVPPEVRGRFDQEDLAGLDDEP